MLLGVLVLTLVIYFPSLKNELTNWDDQEYITNNPHIKGNTPENVSYHFHNYHMGNYHPFTMISLGMDHKEPLDPKPFHVTNLILHLLNCALVFLFVFLLTQKNVIAFIASLLFALHPMHVESVAWASERKDVLYALFFLGALCTYIKYLTDEKGKMKWFLLTTLLFICSLLSKGQAVVLPVIFVLIDWFMDKKISVNSFIPKIPWFALSLVFGVVAIKAQGSIGAVQGTEVYPIADRMLFALYGIGAYLEKLVAPLGLSCFYAFPVKAAGSFPKLFYVFPVLAIGVTALVITFLRKNKYVVFASLFFLISISIVLQLIPVGGAIMADRYTYIPYLGFFILAGKWFSDALEKKMSSGLWRNVSLGLIPLMLIIFSGLTYQRIGVWKDSLTLWDDCIEGGHPSAKAYLNRGKILEDQKKQEEAIRDFNNAIALVPNYSEAYYNRGLAYFYQKKYNEAISDYTAAINYNPTLAVAWYNRAGTYFTIGKPKEALSDALKAKELGYEVDPKFIEVLQNAVKANP